MVLSLLPLVAVCGITPHNCLANSARSKTACTCLGRTTDIYF